MLLLTSGMCAMAAPTAEQELRQQQLRDTMYYYFDTGITDKFDESNKALMDYCLSINDMDAYYNGWYNRIIFELNQSNIFQAYKQALAMSRDMREKKQEDYYYVATGALGLIYADCNNLEGARQCFIDAVEQLTEQKKTGELSPLYMDLAYITFDKYPEEALQWADKAFLLSKDESTMCDVSAFRGMLKFKQNNTKDFLENYKKYKELEAKGMTSIYGKYIEIYYACYQHNYERARELAYEITSPLDRYEFVRNTYEHQGDSVRAYRVLRRQMELTDSLNSIILTDNLKGISNEMEMAEVKQSESRHRIIALTIGIIAAMLMILALTYNIYNRRKFTKRLEQGHQKLQEAYDQLEETTTVKERIESELRIARDIQMSMVPSRFPQRKGLDLFASMTPAREVGGDLYDYMLQGDRLYFCVGDVSGKGVPASLFMAQAIRLFRALAKQRLMPSQIATRINDELTENNENGMFVTMFIALADLTNGHLWFCNAGHNPPVLGGDSLNGSFINMESNAPIGLWPGLEYVGEEIDSIMNRPLFVYTDGLNEAENTQQQQFGDNHLLEILQHTPFESSEQVINHLKYEVERHRDGAVPNDDMTMLCLRIDKTLNDNQ